MPIYITSALVPETLLHKPFIPLNIERLLINETEDKSILLNPAGQPILLSRSHSGIRGHFGRDPNISNEAKIITVSYAYAFMCDLIERWQQANPNKFNFNMVVGRDTRPTAETLSRLHCASFKMAAYDKGVRVNILNVGQVTSPSLESYLRATHSDGGVMITASHNPIGDDGFKYMTGAIEPEHDSVNQLGGLLSKGKMQKILDSGAQLIDSIAAGDQSFSSAFNNFLISAEGIEETWDENSVSSNRAELIRSYFRYIQESLRIDDDQLTSIRQHNQNRGIVVDPGGGGGCQIIAEMFRHFGFVVQEINGEHGIFTRKIEPIGEAMLSATQEMELQASGQIKFEMALVTDQDADRGTTIISLHDGTVLVPGPQDVACLNILAVLGYVVTYKDQFPDFNQTDHDLNPGQLPLSCVFHYPSCGSALEIAEAFGARVELVDVGEMNLVERANSLRAQGYNVPVLAEAYNGGSVPLFSQIRDGSFSALITLLAVGDSQVINNVRRRLGEVETAQTGAGTLLDVIPRFIKIHNTFLVNTAGKPQEGVITELANLIIDKVIGNAGYQKSELEGGKGFRYLPKSENFMFDNSSQTLTDIEKIELIIDRGARIVFFSEHLKSPIIIWFRFSATEGGDLSKLRGFTGSNAEAETLIESFNTLLKDSLKNIDGGVIQLDHEIFRPIGDSIKLIVDLEPTD